MAQKWRKNDTKMNLVNKQELNLTPMSQKWRQNDAKMTRNQLNQKAGNELNLTQMSQKWHKNDTQMTLKWRKIDKN